MGSCKEVIIIKGQHIYRSMVVHNFPCPLVTIPSSISKARRPPHFSTVSWFEVLIYCGELHRVAESLADTDVLWLWLTTIVTTNKVDSIALFA